MNAKTAHATDELSSSAGVRGRIALSLLIIALGTGWLLTAQGIMQGVDWIWTLGLGIVGIGVFMVSGGADKVSLVIGPFFLISSLLSLLRQAGSMSLNTELPLLVIVVGLLFLVVQAPVVPAPRWLVPLPRPE